MGLETPWKLSLHNFQIQVSYDFGPLEGYYCLCDCLLGSHTDRCWYGSTGIWAPYGSYGPSKKSHRPCMAFKIIIQAPCGIIMGLWNLYAVTTIYGRFSYAMSYKVHPKTSKNKTCVQGPTPQCVQGPAWHAKRLPTGSQDSGPYRAHKLPWSFMWLGHKSEVIKSSVCKLFILCVNLFLSKLKAFLKPDDSWIKALPQAFKSVNKALHTAH